jgi:myo-inositol 2-dehydrogenase/D-chiro-inositol 1-dehydrogenase
MLQHWNSRLEYEGDDVRVGLIGAGRIGAFHAQTLESFPDVSEIFVTDPQEARALEVAQKVGATVAVDAEALVGRIDAMVVAAATDVHAPMMHLAADAQIPVFCEKPIAADLAATDAVVEHLRASGVPSQIGFQRRFDAGYRRAKVLVESGAIGHLYSARTTTHDYEPPPAGYHDTGIFRDTQIHDFDIVRFVTGQEIVEVYADGFTVTTEEFGDGRPVDTGVVVLSLSEGTRVVMSGIRHDPMGHDVRMELFGTGDSVTVGVDPSLPLRSLEDGVPEPVEPTPKTFLDRFAPAYRAELEVFIRVAHGSQASPCTPEDAREALRVAVACDVSREQHRPVAVKEIT